MADWLESFLRGAANTVTGGNNDEAVAKILAALPFDDKTGIPREYAGGQYEQYRDQQRADDAEAQRAYPKNYGAGQLAGAAPAAIATGGLGGLGAVGAGTALGAVHGFGQSSNKGQELLKDTVRGAALGGATASAGNALQAAGPAIKQLWKNGPPPAAPQLQPALAGATPRPSPQLGTVEAPTGPSPNFSKSSVAPSARGLPAERPAPASLPPASLEEAEAQARAVLNRVKFRPNPQPLELAPKLPDAEGAVTGRRLIGDETGEEFISPMSDKSAARLLEQPEPAPSNVTPLKKTLRPGKRPKAEAPAPAGAPVQPELPGIPEPQYVHHATPASNATGVAELGLRPEQGGKNFNFKKNQNTLYMSPPTEADMWAQKLEDFSGEKPLKLRTTAPAQQVQGSAPGVLTRNEPVPPERIQYQAPTGSWHPVKELRPGTVPPQGMSPEQLKLLAAMLGLGGAAATQKR